MCIDDQLISAYLDGELKEPYLSEVREHLSYCQACRDRLEDFRHLDDKIKSYLSLSEEEKNRNRDKISSLLEEKCFSGGKRSLLRRKIELSVSGLVTAAAALVFVFIGGFMFFGTSTEQTEDILPSFALQADSSNVRFVSDSSGLENYTLEEILKYLDSKGYNVDISIKGLTPLETSTPDAENAE